MAPRVLLVASLALLLASGACAAPSPPPPPCPFTASEFSQINYDPASKACVASSPLATRCDACVCALAAPLAPLVAAKGLGDLSRDQATQLITSCISLGEGKGGRVGGESGRPATWRAVPPAAWAHRPPAPPPPLTQTPSLRAHDPGRHQRLLAHGPAGLPGHPRLPGHTRRQRHPRVSVPRARVAPTHLPCMHPVTCPPCKDTLPPSSFQTTLTLLT